MEIATLTESISSIYRYVVVIVSFLDVAFDINISIKFVKKFKFK